MESTETGIRTIAAVLAVLLAGLLPAGCQTSPGSREASQHYSDMEDTENMSFRMQRRFGLGQSNAVVQSDARKAAEALERAEAELETCDEPDAESYRDAARAAAEAVESVALESSGIVESVQAATETVEYGGRLVAQAEDRVGQSWRAFKEAQRELRSLEFNDFDRMQPMSVGQVWEKAETQFNLVRDVTRDLLTAGDDLRMEMGREQWGEIVALVDSQPDPDVDLPDPGDPNAILASLFEQAGAANSEWIALESVEVDLPTDRSTRVEQMGYSEREALENHISALHDAGETVDDAHREFERMISYIETTQWRLDEFMVQGSERTAEIAQQTGPLAAEATRNAWLAVEACGGEVPPEHQGMLENPFDDYTTIPQWNSTFWDISSP